MLPTHDPELEQFKLSIDLVAYARSAGYTPRPSEGARGLTVLDHPNRDCIVAGQIPDGPWIYASVPDYAPRAAGEPAEQALARLHQCINRTKDRGSIVEFVEQRDGTGRWDEVPLERARERLREFCATGRSLDFEGALRPPPYGDGPERSVGPPRDAPRPDAPIAAPEAVARRSNPELNQRRYDWSPPAPSAPPEPEVDHRLRRWREAQAAIDRKVGGSREPEGPARSPGPAAVPPPPRDPNGPPLPGKAFADRADGFEQRKLSEIHRRRYDCTPAAPSLDTLKRATRGRSTDRDR
jgi:hypothetical protein